MENIVQKRAEFPADADRQGAGEQCYEQGKQIEEGRLQQPDNLFHCGAPECVAAVSLRRPHNARASRATFTDAPPRPSFARTSPSLPVIAVWYASSVRSFPTSAAIAAGFA